MVSVEYEDNTEPTIVADNDNILASIPHDGNPAPNCFEISTEAYGEDADGDALTYVWTNLLDGSVESNTSQFAKQFCGVGSYEFEIRVTDCYNASSTQLITIEVLPEENVAPIIFSMKSIFEACKEDSSSDLCDFIVSCNPGQQILVNGLNLVCDEDNGTDCSVPDYAYTGNSTDQIECTWSTPEGVVESCEISIDCPEKDDLWNEFTMSDEELLYASYISGYQLTVVDPYPESSQLSDDSIVIESPYKLDNIPLDNATNLISFKYLSDYTTTLNPHPDCEHVDCNGILFNVQGAGECQMNSLITAGAAASYNPSTGEWTGSLSAINDDEGYWLISENYNSDCETTLEIIGIETGCEEVVYNINQIALLSYVGANNSAIEDAIHVEDQDPCIKSVISSGTAATWDENAQIWMGSLNDFKHGIGYWILTDNSDSDCEQIDFSWRNCEESEDNLTRSTNQKKTILPAEISYVATTNQAFYFINEITLDGVSLSEDKDWYILAYSNENIVGARKWSGFGTDLPVMGYDKLIESSANYPKTGDIISIKLYNNTTGETIDLAFSENNYPFGSNQIYIIGSISNIINRPDYFALGSSYPNPFNPTTTLSFAIPVDSDVSLSIYNLQGREVTSLIDGDMDAGYHSVVWNADNHSSGVYFVKIIAGDYVDTQKLMLMK
jgi:5-hydroxyisourate hydrolase-like protein (transthyretin family)